MEIACLCPVSCTIIKSNWLIDCCFTWCKDVYKQYYSKNAIVVKMSHLNKQMGRSIYCYQEKTWYNGRGWDIWTCNGPSQTTPNNLVRSSHYNSHYSNFRSVLKANFVFYSTRQTSGHSVRRRGCTLQLEVDAILISCGSQCDY